MKCGGGADQDGVDEYRQHLDQSLFYRMRDSRACRRVGSGTDSGLVGEQSPFDAVHDTGPGESAEDSLEVKGVAEKISANMPGIRLVVGDYDDKVIPAR